MSDDQQTETGKKSEGKDSFISSLRNKLLQQPEVPLAKLIPGLRDIVRLLPADEYAAYLAFLDRHLAVDTHELIVDQIDIIADRLEKDIRAGIDSTDPKEQAVLDEIVNKTKAALGSLAATTGGRIPAAQLKKLYDLVHSDIPSLRIQAAEYIPALIRFENMKADDDSAETEISLRETTEKDIISMIVDPTKRDIDTAVTLLRSLQSEFGAGDLRNLYFKTIAAITEGDTETIKFVFKTFANFFSLEIALKLLVNETKGDAVDPTLKKNADYILRLFTKEGAVFLNPDELYEDTLDMRTWKPSVEHLPHDVEVLLREFPDSQTLLDVACGAGPHIKGLTEAGKTVTGIDITERNVTEAKLLNPGVDIREGDWFKMPFEDKKFDGGYCIGRSAAYNFTVFEWLRFLKETQRVVKGPFMIDHASPNKGGVGKRINAYQDTADELGITNREHGAHIGNPLDNAFTYRNILSDEQMKAIGILCGYEAKKVDEYVYVDQTNKENTNIYWKLIPLQQKPSDEQLLEAARGAFTSYQSL